MTLKAYFDTIKEKTGKTPEDFKVLAEKKGFLKPGVKVGEIVKWLKDDYGLGRGHAMAIVLVLKQVNAPRQTTTSRIDKLFTGSKSHWRKAYDALWVRITRFGPDVTVSPTDSYIGILRSGRKFAVVQVISDQLNIGIKLKGVPSGGRLGAAGTWNAMVTHRVRIEDPKQIDAEVISWLRQAYDKVQ